MAKDKPEIQNLPALKKLVIANLTARHAIKTLMRGKTGFGDEIPCPVCHAGTMKYFVSSVNGHIHAKCSTDDCVSFFE